MSAEAQAVEARRVASPAEACLVRAEWQPFLFAGRPRRPKLLTLEPSWTLRPVRLRVQRNQAFEFVASVMRPFLAFAGLEAEFVYSDYDDALSLSLEGGADAEIVWLDFERYGEDFNAESLAAWVAERVARLRAVSPAPILVADWAGDHAAAQSFNQRLREALRSIPGATACDQAAIARELADDYLDSRAAKIAGMALSDAACVLSARMFGSVWLPAVLAPRLKAILLDLDGTLYDGVLGEDGVQGVRLEEGHLALQKNLVRLHEKGIFLAIVSRNEERDVEELLGERGDFPLKAEHFSARAIGWRPKPAGVREVAQALRIGTDAMLFIDNNPGELAQVAAELPEIHCLHAEPDAQATARALSYYPGLTRLVGSETDALRVADLAAATEREALAESAADPKDYLTSLRVRLGFALDPRGGLARLFELSSKTNQFNAALKRFSEAEVARRLADPECRTVSIRLRDRLSESGVIAGLFARREGDRLVVDELCISCRALGRGLEDLMVTEALLKVLSELPASQVAFSYREGPRNGPARDWLARYTGAELAGPEGLATIAWDQERATALVEGTPASISWEAGDDA